MFQAAEAGKAIAMGEAWQATLGFTFQIYFDFSGYTDMALGLALLFGIVLPQNFDVPYRVGIAAGFLAPLAHDAVALPARLSLHRRSAATGTASPCRSRPCSPP